MWIVLCLQLTILATRRCGVRGSLSVYGWPSWPSMVVWVIWYLQLTVLATKYNGVGNLVFTVDRLGHQASTHGEVLVGHFVSTVYCLDDQTWWCGSFCLQQQLAVYTCQLVCMMMWIILSTAIVDCILATLQLVMWIILSTVDCPGH